MDEGACFNFVMLDRYICLRGLLPGKRQFPVDRLDARLLLWYSETWYKTGNIYSTDLGNAGYCSFEEKYKYYIMY